MITIYLQTYGECPRNEKYKTEHGIGLSLLSQGLSELHDIKIAAEDMDAHLEYVENKKPYLKDYPHIFFNITHCDGLVACGFSDRPLGIDMEKIGAFRESVIRKLLTEPEKEFLESMREDPDKHNEYFYRFWTLKESRIKQSGHGLAMPLTDFSFTFAKPQKNGSEPVITCSEPNLYFHQQIVCDNYLLSVCSDRPIEEVKKIC